MLRIVALLALLAGSAEAHDVRGEALLLDITDDAVIAELHVPVAQLALAGGQAPTTEQLAADLHDHVSLETPTGVAFTLHIEGIAIAKSEVVCSLRFVPPASASALHFIVRDELVLRAVINANVFVFSHRDLATGEPLDAPTLVGDLHYQQRSLEIRAASPPQKPRWPWIAAAIAVLLGAFAVHRTKELP